MKNSAVLVWLRRYVEFSTASFTRPDVLLYILNWPIPPDVDKGVCLLRYEIRAIMLCRINLRKVWHLLRR